MEFETVCCKCCGAALDLTKMVGQVVRCDYCGASHIVARSDRAKNFLDQGEHDLDTCRFADARAAYEKAAELDGNEPEAYFGMALADFKVQYLKDEVSNRLRPICHDPSDRSFYDDPNFRKALALSTEEQKREYKRRGREIDEINEEFNALKKSGLSYDCFLCAKVTEEDGTRTADCNHANDIYYYLKDEGYKPFFSEREMKGRTGSNYEALILYALYTSECMLIVCSDESYLQTKWVKNEYTRFMVMMANDEKARDAITFVFSGTPIEKLPNGKKIQGVDYSTFGASDKIKEFVARHVSLANESPVPAPEPRPKPRLKLVKTDAECDATEAEQLQKQQQVQTRSQEMEKLRKQNAANISDEVLLEANERAQTEKECKKRDEEERRRYGALQDAAEGTWTRSLQSYQFKCKNCGDVLDVCNAVNGVIECPYCHTPWIVPKQETSPEALKYLHDGSAALDVCKFEDAFTYYQKAAEFDPKEPEAFFGMAIASFKIQYLQDSVNNRLQPICHEVTKKKIFANKNYQTAIALATSSQRVEYERRAAEIDQIFNQFNQLSQTDQYYDCFICVKVTDNETGNHTTDSKDADYIYRLLKEHGYSPFYSEYEIRNKTGSDYEAHILYALYSSECMLIVCSDEKYLQTRWVRSDYIRFLQLVNDEKKEDDSITIVFHGTPIERLPGRPGKLQGIDFGLRESDNKIIEFVESHISPARKQWKERIEKLKEKENQLLEEKIHQQIERLNQRLQNMQNVGGGAMVTLQSLLTRAEQELMANNFDGAAKFYERVLEADPFNGYAWWGMFLINFNATSEEDILKQTDFKMLGTIEENNNYLNATRYADDALKERIGKFMRSLKALKTVLIDAERAERLFREGEELYDEKEYTQATKKYRMAAEMGHTAAQCNLGLCYDNGQGVPRSCEEAARWYRKAAAQGSAVAQNNLGLCYENGEGVPQSYEEAARWYRKAAEQGSAVAQNNLGLCYENGRGVAQNYEESVKWYKKAAAQGESLAQSALKRLGYLK